MGGLRRGMMDDVASSKRHSHKKKRHLCCVIIQCVNVCTLLCTYVYVHLLLSICCFLMLLIPIFRPRFFSIPKSICPSHVIVLKSLVHNNGYSQPIVTATGGRDIRCATQFIHYRLNQRLMGMLGWIKGVCFHQRRRRRWWRRFGRCF